MKYFLCVMGMVMIVEGMPYFSFPSKMKQVMMAVVQTEDSYLRKFGFVLMLAGLLVVYVSMKAF